MKIKDTKIEENIKTFSDKNYINIFIDYGQSLEFNDLECCREVSQIDYASFVLTKGRTPHIVDFEQMTSYVEEEHARLNFPAYEYCTRMHVVSIFKNIKSKMIENETNLIHDLDRINEILLGKNFDELLDKYRYEGELFRRFDFNTIGDAIYFEEYHTNGTQYKTRDNEDWYSSK